MFLLFSSCDRAAKIGFVMRQRCVSKRLCRMYENSCGTAATKKCTKITSIQFCLYVSWYHDDICDIIDEWFVKCVQSLHHPNIVSFIYEHYTSTTGMYNRNFSENSAELYRVVHCVRVDGRWRLGNVYDKSSMWQQIDRHHVNFHRIFTYKFIDVDCCRSMQVASALAYLQSLNLVHTSITPSTVSFPWNSSQKMTCTDSIIVQSEWYCGKVRSNITCCTERYRPNRVWQTEPQREWNFLQNSLRFYRCFQIHYKDITMTNMCRRQKWCHMHLTLLLLRLTPLAC